jgi:hypothetical protein
MPGQYLRRINSSWYFRTRVPEDIRKHLLGLRYFFHENLLEADDKGTFVPMQIQPGILFFRFPEFHNLDRKPHEQALGYANTGFAWQGFPFVLVPTSWRQSRTHFQISLPLHLVFPILRGYYRTMGGRNGTGKIEDHHRL